MKTLKLVTSLFLFLISSVILQAQDTYIIDNFAPYIKKVEISTGGEIIYQEEWTWNQETSSLNYSLNCKNNAANGNYDAVITICTSESMQSINLGVEGFVVDAQAKKYNSVGTEWYYIIDGVDIKTVYNEQTIRQYSITIDGKDKNGNSIQGFSNTQTTIPLEELKKRNSPTEWSANGKFVPDTRHIFKVGTPSDNSVGCMFASFAVQDPTLEDDQKAIFINNSVGASSYKWAFQGGNPASSSETEPVVEYANAGTYSVILTVSNETTSHTESKLDYIIVTKTQAYFAEIDFSYDPETGKFTGQAPGNISSWEWGFSSGPADGTNNPVVYHNFSDSEVIHTATLTVYFADDGSHKSKTQRIYSCGYSSH